MASVPDKKYNANQIAELLAYNPSAQEPKDGVDNVAKLIYKSTAYDAYMRIVMRARIEQQLLYSRINENENVREKYKAQLGDFQQRLLRLSNELDEIIQSYCKFKEAQKKYNDEFAQEKNVVLDGEDRKQFQDIFANFKKKCDYFVSNYKAIGESILEFSSKVILEPHAAEQGMSLSLTESKADSKYGADSSVTQRARKQQRGSRSITDEDIEIVIRNLTELDGKHPNDGYNNILEMFEDNLDILKGDNHKEKYRARKEVKNIINFPGWGRKERQPYKVMKRAQMQEIVTRAEDHLKRKLPTASNIYGEMVRGYSGMLEAMVKSKKLKEGVEIDFSKLPPIPVYCIDGPPGTGKTTLAKEFAAAFGMGFHKVVMTGKDEGEIALGRPQHWNSPAPGFVAEAMIKTGQEKIVILLDEADRAGDKLKQTLGELLEESQGEYNDDYFHAAIRKGQVLFVLTTNHYDQLPDLVRDRVTLVSFPGYNVQEKIRIIRDSWAKGERYENVSAVKFYAESQDDADRYKNRQDESNKMIGPNEYMNLNRKNPPKTDKKSGVIEDPIECIISDYVTDPGVRQAQKLLRKVYDAAATQVRINGHSEANPFIVTADFVREVLGKPAKEIKLIQELNARADAGREKLAEIRNEIQKIKGEKKDIKEINEKDKRSLTNLINKYERKLDEVLGYKLETIKHLNTRLQIHPGDTEITKQIEIHNETIRGISDVDLNILIEACRLVGRSAKRFTAFEAANVTDINRAKRKSNLSDDDEEEEELKENEDYEGVEESSTVDEKDRKDMEKNKGVVSGVSTQKVIAGDKSPRSQAAEARKKEIPSILNIGNVSNLPDNIPAAATQDWNETRGALSEKLNEIRARMWRGIRGPSRFTRTVGGLSSPRPFGTILSTDELQEQYKGSVSDCGELLEKLNIILNIDTSKLDNNQYAEYTPSVLDVLELLKTKRSDLSEIVNYTGASGSIDITPNVQKLLNNSEWSKMFDTIQQQITRKNDERSSKLGAISALSQQELSAFFDKLNQLSVPIPAAKSTRSNFKRLDDNQGIHRVHRRNRSERAGSKPGQDSRVSEDSSRVQLGRSASDSNFRRGRQTEKSRTNAHFAAQPVFTLPSGFDEKALNALFENITEGLNRNNSSIPESERDQFRLPPRVESKRDDGKPSHENIPALQEFQRNGGELLQNDVKKLQDLLMKKIDSDADAKQRPGEIAELMFKIEARSAVLYEAYKREIAATNATGDVSQAQKTKKSPTEFLGEITELFGPTLEAAAAFSKAVSSNPDITSSQVSGQSQPSTNIDSAAISAFEAARIAAVSNMNEQLQGIQPDHIGGGLRRRRGGQRLPRDATTRSETKQDRAFSPKGIPIPRDNIAERLDDLTLALKATADALNELNERRDVRSPGMAHNRSGSRVRKQDEHRFRDDIIAYNETRGDHFLSMSEDEEATDAPERRITKLNKLQENANNLLDDSQDRLSRAQQEQYDAKTLQDDAAENIRRLQDQMAELYRQFGKQKLKAEESAKAVGKSELGEADDKDIKEKSEMRELTAKITQAQERFERAEGLVQEAKSNADVAKAKVVQFEAQLGKISELIGNRATVGELKEQLAAESAKLAAVTEERNRADSMVGIYQALLEEQIKQRSRNIEPSTIDILPRDLRTGDAELAQLESKVIAAKRTLESKDIESDPASRSKAEATVRAAQDQLIDHLRKKLALAETVLAEANNNMSSLNGSVNALDSIISMQPLDRSGSNRRDSDRQASNAQRSDTYSNIYPTSPRGRDYDSRESSANDQSSTTPTPTFVSFGTNDLRLEKKSDVHTAEDQKAADRGSSTPTNQRQRKSRGTRDLPRLSVSETPANKPKTAATGGSPRSDEKESRGNNYNRSGDFIRDSRRDSRSDSRDDRSSPRGDAKRLVEDKTLASRIAASRLEAEGVAASATRLPGIFESRVQRLIADPYQNVAIEVVAPGPIDETKFNEIAIVVQGKISEIQGRIAEGKDLHEELDENKKDMFKGLSLINGNNDPNTRTLVHQLGANRLTRLAVMQKTGRSVKFVSVEHPRPEDDTLYMMVWGAKKTADVLYKVTDENLRTARFNIENCGGDPGDAMSAFKMVLIGATMNLEPVFKDKPGEKKTIDLIRDPSFSNIQVYSADHDREIALGEVYEEVRRLLTQVREQPNIDQKKMLLEHIKTFINGITIDPELEKKFHPDQ